MLNTQFARENRRKRRRRMGSRRRRTSSSSSSWSDLYPEIISSISQHLKSRLDILSFRGVCKQWRAHSVLPPPSFLSPLLPYRVRTSYLTPSPQYISGSNRHPHHQIELSVKSIYLITPIVVDNIESEASSPTYLSSSWMVMATEFEPRIIQLRHPLTGGQIENLPEALDLTQFKVSELAQGYELEDVYWRNRVSKVTLCSSSASPTPLSDCTVMFLSCGGGLRGIRLSESIHPQWSHPRARDNIQFKEGFDDFVSFKGMNVVVDRHGCLFTVEYEAEDSSPLVVTGVLAADHTCDHKGRRKRLVVDPLSHQLYLVERVHITGARFRVYHFNEKFNKWDKVKALCHRRALFVGVRHCFFAPTSGFSGCPVNCIIFVTDSFPPYPEHRRSFDNCLLLTKKMNAKERIGVYHLGKRRNKFSFISDYPELLQMMEPPPACFSSSEWESNDDEEMQPCSNSRHNSSQSNEDEEEVQRDSNSRDDPSLRNDEDEDEAQSESNSEDDPSKSQEQTNERPSTSAAQGDATRTPTMNIVEHLAEEETPRKEIIHSAILGSPTSLTQSNKSNTSTVKFEGLDIRSDVVPTLEKIWSKHGNILENSCMHNGDVVARGLELLANVVQILESNSARSLTGSQADYLSSALSDLQCMHFRVDWLAPMVEKAVALHKSKPLVDSFNKLSQSKAKVAERISKLIDELAETYKYEKKLEEDMARMSKIIPFSGEVDFSKPLGGGL